MNHARMQTVAAFLVGLAVLLKVDATTGADVAPENVVDRIAIDGEMIFLPASVAGEARLLLLDTGCTGSVFDLTLLRSPAVGSRQGRVASGSYITLPVFDSPPASLGRIDLSRYIKRVHGLDLSQLRSVSGVEFYGVIGTDFLEHHVVQIDMDRQECLILSQATGEMGERIDLRVRDGVPNALVRVAGTMTREWFLIDTGHGASGSLRKPLANALVTLKSAKGVAEYLTMDASRETRKRLVQAKSATIGPFKITGPVFDVGRQNILGMTFLSRFVVTFDFPNKCMYLRPSKRFDTPDTWDRSGLHIVRRDGKTVIHSVDKASVAEMAGLRDGQEIVKIGDTDAKEAKLGRLRELLCREGQSVPVVARRDGERFEVSLQLK